MFGWRTRKRPPGRSTRCTSASAASTSSFVRKCSKTLLAKTTSTLAASRQPRSCAGPEWTCTSAAAWSRSRSSVSTAHFSPARMWFTNSQKPAPRSSTTASAAIHCWKKSAHRTRHTASFARRSAALKRVSYSSGVATPEASSERQHVPAEIAWKPAEQPEARLTMYTIAPHRGNLRETVAREERLHRDLEPELETVAALKAERGE